MWLVRKISKGKNVNLLKADLSYADFTNSIFCDVNFNKCECLQTNLSINFVLINIFL